MTIRRQQVLLLCGGVGGAKLVNGFEQIAGVVDSCAVVNVGDDFEHLGLAISPDIDTVLYTLAGISNKQQGWGVEGESWRVMERLGDLGGETWFRLGDLDLATHLYRTASLKQGASLTEVTRDMASRLSVKTRIIPATDHPLRTRVATDMGLLEFQQYFVRERCEPKAQAIEFRGVEDAHPSPALEQMLASEAIDAVILAPSNPFLSIEPILAIPGMLALLRNCSKQVIAMCPIIDGRAVKGPAAKMMEELSIPVSVTGWTDYLNRRYPGFIDRWIVDHRDEDEAEGLRGRGLAVESWDTLMMNEAQQKSLALQLFETMVAPCR